MLASPDNFSLAADLFTVSESSDDPVAWAKRRCGVHLWSIQQEIARSVAANKYTVVRSANGLGKSFLAALLCGWWIDTHPVGDTKIVTTAPSSDQVHGILWEEIRGLHAAAGLPGKVQLTDKWLINDRLVAQGRKPPDYNQTALLGTHARYVLVILDESCGIPEWIWTTIERITTGDDCRILAIGNPDDPNSHFKKLFDGDKWTKFKIGAFDSPAYTGEWIPDELRHKLTTRQWFEDRKNDWGESHPFYISGVLGEFPIESAWSVVRTADAYACRIWAPREAHELLPVELGIDVGAGGDETIIRERRGIKAGREWQNRSDKPEVLAPIVVHAINETGATAVKIDSIGIGTGLIGELRNLKKLGAHNARIIGVNVAEKSVKPKLYNRLRSELWWECGRLLAERREFDLSEMENADVTIGQMLDVQFEYDINGRIQVEFKDDIRKRTGRSPDNADALLLAFYQPSHYASQWFEYLMGRTA